MSWLGTEDARRRFALSTLLIITCLLGARRIGDDAAVMLGGDMARYVMNGVFVHDLIADGGVTSYQDLASYAERYYAKYPALSLGHHPPVAYLSVVPFYWLFGVTLLAARLAALCWFVAAVWGLYDVGVRLYNWQVAAWASALFVTNLIVLRAGQYLLSEIPMTALVLWALAMLLRFCRTRRAIYFTWFAVFVIASLYAKQLALLIMPVYAAVLLWHFGWRGILTRRAIVPAAAVLVLAVPLVIMTVGVAPANLTMAIRNATRLFTGVREVSVGRILQTVLLAHLSAPALIAVVAGLVILLMHRRYQAYICLVWIVSVIGGCVILAGPVEPARYAFGAMPAYFLLIAGLLVEAHARAAKIAVVSLLLITVGWQVWTIKAAYPSGAGGYETAVEYVVSHAQEPVVLYDSAVDTGYFVFFMRKHDPQGRHVIVRADKLVPARTEDNTKPVEIDFRGELQRLGIRWIVVEERQTGHRLLRAFHDDLKSAAFVERLRIPVVSTAAPGLHLRVYEYLDAQPVNLDAEVRIGVPLAQRRYSLRLRDLLGER